MSPRCSARPDDLYRVANDIEAVIAELRRQLASFDLAIEFFVLRTHGFFAALRWSDPLWALVRELDSLAQFTGSVGAAFEAAGGRGTAGRATVITTEVSTIDGWRSSASWQPAKQLEHGTGNAWAEAVFGPRCVSWGDAGYEGAGFISGPDGRHYPLVAPHVVRDGTTYNADDGARSGQPSVLDLDGRDPGWMTIREQIGVERWRDAPGVAGRILAGVGASAAGSPLGSTENDVRAVVIAPGRRPTLGKSLVPSAAPAASPPVYMPPAPPVPPPNKPDLEYPLGQTSVAAGGMNLAPVVLDGLVGAAHADLGLYDAYDIVFQENSDGRIRALYQRVFVGFDASGNAELSSVYVTGPDRNDQVPIEYAPAT
jgi:hypothetical protein